MHKSISQEVTIPAGEYYLGDPCYALTYEQWDRVIAKTNCFGAENSILQDSDDEALAVVDGGIILGFGTAYGDGYYDTEIPGIGGFSIMVDSGLIGLVSKDLAEGSGNSSIQFMKLVRLPSLTVCTNEDGVMTFGMIEVNTRDDSDDDDEDSDDEYEYD